MSKKRLLPDGMLKRLPAMGLWVLGMSLTSLAQPELGASTALAAIVGMGLSMLLFVMWGPRTRPRRNAFWFLVHIVLIAGLIALVQARPLLGLIAALPVTILWLHDAPSSPTAMLGWGLIVLLFQPDGFWAGAEPEQAWNVLIASMVLIFAAQTERNRLAARQFAQAGFTYGIFRLVSIGLLSMLIIASRESLRVVNVFTNLGIDASGRSGQLAMLGIVLLSIAVAVALFRVRPARPPPVLVDAAPRRAAASTQGAEPAGAIDFDSDAPRPKKATAQKRREAGTSRATEATAAKRTKPAAQRARSPASSPRSEGPRTPAKRKAKDEAAPPGELDFD